MPRIKVTTKYVTDVDRVLKEFNLKTLLKLI